MVFDSVLYWEALLTVANIIIAVFTLVYGILFIFNTVKNEHRQTWNFLIIAIALFLGFESFKLLKTFGVLKFDLLILVFEISFNAVLLFVFIFQRNLIQKYPYIKIEKSHGSKKKSGKKKR